MKIIDPHIHLFDIENGDYLWLKPENGPFWPDKEKIARSFNESALLLAKSMQLKGFVHIEAGYDNQNPWRELQYLENSCEVAFKSIALLDITMPHQLFLQQFELLACKPSFVGVRYILEDVSDDFFSQAQVVENLKHLGRCKVIFELQFPFERTVLVDEIINLLNKYPDFKMAICHGGFAPTSSQMKQIWRKNVAKIAEFKHVVIKCSGQEMLSTTHRHIDAASFQAHINECISLFSDKRVLLASNFPLISLAMPYSNYWQMLANMYAEQPKRWSKLSIENALNFYFH